MSAADAATVGSSYSCHTNLLGAVVANSGTAALADGGAAIAELKHYNWMYPLVPNVESVTQAQALAKAGITPLPAVALPVGGTSASAWGQATLDLLSDLNKATADKTMVASMAVTVDACAYESESMNRAAAYWSVICKYTRHPPLRSHPAAPRWLRSGGISEPSCGGPFAALQLRFQAPL